MSKVMLYKAGGRQLIHGKRLQTRVVAGDEIAAHIAKGWKKTPSEVESLKSKTGNVKKALLLVAAGFGLTVEDSATDEELAVLIIAETETHDGTAELPTTAEAEQTAEPAELTEREKLEAKADDLGLKYRSDIGDDTLKGRIEEAETASNELD